MISDETMTNIRNTKYTLLGGGSHSDGEINNALALAVLIEVIIPVFERNTEVLNKLLEKMEEK